MRNLLLIQPILALLSLTLVVAFIMMWTRVKKMKELKVRPRQAEDASALKSLLPREVMRISDNYNHLLEQPIVFYVLCILIIVLEKVDDAYLYLAWSYVVLRLFHSITHICFANVMTRFFLFLMSWLILGAILMKLMFQLI